MYKNMKKWINLKLCSPKRVLIHVDLVSQSIVGVIYESFGALTLWETIMYIILFQFVSVWNFSVHRRIKKRKSLHVHKLKDSFFNSLAERQALEPVLSQNITQSQMPINNQLITIIIKSKYYRISLAISIFGCIFGCRISNTPSHEHQTKHHFCTWKPQKERRSNRGERTHPYACHIRKPSHRVYNRLPHWYSQVGCRQATCKERMYQ